MSDAVLALLVVVPILASVLPVVGSFWSTRTGWSIATATCLLEAGLAAWLVWLVVTDSRVVHELGGFPAPYGIVLVGDGLSVPIAALVAVVALGVLAYARTAGPRRNSFYAAYLLLVGGLMGVTLTGDLFNMFVFLEITGLATYALVASDRSGRSAIASLRYLILGTTGASLFLVGVGYAFIATGTLNMVDLARELDGIYTSRLVVAAFGFITVGLGLKAALFPLHTWQPDAYSYAPDTVTAFVSALVSTVAAYAIGRIYLVVFTVEFFAAVPLARDAVLWLATISILAGSALAVVQTEIKRMLAYSSVAQFGMIVAAFALTTPDAVVGGVVHLVGHGLTKGGLFAAAGILAATQGARTVGDYARLGYRAPIAAAAFGVLGLTLVGVPPTVGFLGKWYIALGAIRAGVWPVAVVILASTLLTLAYIARLLERLYFAASVPEPAVAESVDVGAVGDGGTVESGDDAVATTGLRRPDSRAPAGVSAGMLAVVAVTAVLVVALGFTDEAIWTLLEPFLGRVLS